MGRPPNITEDRLLDAAMWRFWTCGYHATSIDDLLRVTGATRHSLYKAYGNKHALFLQCLDRYRREVVTPAFAAVEAPGATLREVRNYFEVQISRATGLGLPGPGCLIANSTTELAPHDDAVMAVVIAHHKRLASGFSRAIGAQAKGALPPAEHRALAELLASGAQGLWSWSRAVHQAAPLRRQVATLMDLIERRLAL